MPKPGITPSQPFMGQAPEPARSIDLTGGDETAMLEREAVFSPDGSRMETPVDSPGPQRPLSSYAREYERPNLPPAPLPEAVAPAPPPVPPAAAPHPDMMQELRSEIAELREQLQSRPRTSEDEMAMEEMRLQLALAQTAAASPAAGSGVDFLAGLDDDDTLTAGQARQIVAQLGQLIPAAARQSTWDLTQEEIQAVWAENPILARTPEPHRSEYLQRLVQMRRRKLGQANGQVATQPQAAAGTTQSSARTTRQVPGRVVPDVESRGAPAAGPEPSAPRDEIAYAQAMYKRVRADRNLSRRERERQAKYWRDRVIILQGGDPRTAHLGYFSEQADAPLD